MATRVSVFYEQTNANLGRVNIISLTLIKKSLKLPSYKRGNSSVGRARPCQGRGREFESRFPLQILKADF
jgi:hypothetical protein